MERLELNVWTIDHKDVGSAKEIALQAWNVKKMIENRDYEYFDVKFLEGINTLIVKFTDFGNIENVVKSWGEVTYKEKEFLLLFDSDDLTRHAVNQMDKVFTDLTDSKYEDTHTGEVTFKIVE